MPLLHRRLRLVAALVLVLGGANCRRGAAPADQSPPPPRPSSAIEIEAAYATASLSNDPDDPAIWVHPADPARSLIITTMKVPAPAGALIVFGMDGQIRQIVSGIDRPNNVDVEYAFRLGGRSVDIAVVTERYARRLRVFAIDPEAGRLEELGPIAVLEDQPGESGAPMGIALYRRATDGALYAIVAPKAGPTEGYLWQYRLLDSGGRPGARLARRFGKFSGTTVREENEIEAVAVDDALGYVYYADEADGIHKWHADPDHPDAGGELAHFGRSGYRGDREGIAIYALDDGTGYLVCTDQLAGDTEYHIYAREGAPGAPHDHSREIAILRGGADSTDGIEISSARLGPALPHGALVAMNSTPRNFLVFRWEDLASAVEPKLRIREIVGAAALDSARAGARLRGTTR